jgi:hypothetical protein
VGGGPQETDQNSAIMLFNIFGPLPRRNFIVQLCEIIFELIPDISIL